MSPPSSQPALASPPELSGPGKLYALGVVALAVFLTGVVAIHRPTAVYYASAVVSYQRPELAEVPGEVWAQPAEAEAAALLSEGTLVALVDELQLAGSDADAALRTAWVQSLRKRLTVLPTRGARPGQTLIAVQHAAHDPEEAVRVLDWLARDFTRLHHGHRADAKLRERLADAQRQATTAAARLAEAQTELDHFVAQHLEALGRAGVKVAQTNPGREPTSGAAGQDAPSSNTQSSNTQSSNTPSSNTPSNISPGDAPATPAAPITAPVVAPHHGHVASQAPASAEAQSAQPYSAAPPIAAPPDTAAPQLELEAPVRATSDHAASDVPAANGPLAASPVNPAGPRAQLRQRVAQLKQRQEELAAERTWADAEVRSLGDEILALERELRDMARRDVLELSPHLKPGAAPPGQEDGSGGTAPGANDDNGAPAPRDPGPAVPRGALSAASAVPPPAPATTAPATSNGRSGADAPLDVVRQYQALQAHREAHFRLWSHAAAAQVELSRAIDDAPQTEVQLIEPPQVLGRRLNGMAPRLVVWWGFASLLAGCVAAAWANDDTRWRLRTADDVTQALHLPILGIVADDRPATPRTDDEDDGPTPPWVWWLVRAAEVALVLLAAGLAARVMLSSQLAGDLARDPLATLSAAWRWGV